MSSLSKSISIIFVTSFIMRATSQHKILLRRLAAFLLSTTYEVAAIPAPQAANTGSGSIAPTVVTEVTTLTDRSVVSGNLLLLHSPHKY